MILVCPSCSARYLIPSKTLGPEGRDVRCAKCSHQWYQERDEHAPVDNFESASQYDDSSDETYDLDNNDVDATLDDLPDIAEEPDLDESLVEEEGEHKEVYNKQYGENSDIPDSVKPNHKSNVPAFAKDVVRQPASLQAKLTGYMAALTIFGLLIVGGLIFKNEVIVAWPPSVKIYELAGMDTSLKGEQLVIESLQAKIQKDVDGRNYLMLQGRVINLTEETQPIPPLVARLRSTNGDDGDSWGIDSPLEELAPGEAFTFTSDYPAVPRGVGSVNLSFVPVVKL